MGALGIFGQREADAEALVLMWVIGGVIFVGVLGFLYSVWCTWRHP